MYMTAGLVNQFLVAETLPKIVERKAAEARGRTPKQMVEKPIMDELRDTVQQWRPISRNKDLRNLFSLCWAYNSLQFLRAQCWDCV